MTRDDPRALLAKDRAHVWHPYASAVDPLPVLPVESASGVRLRLTDGTELIDGMSSWWAAIHGYGVPEIQRAIVEQAARLPHVMFGGLTHAPAANLAAKLVQLTPAPLTRVFFSDSGSVSVEVAIKMALQYWHGTGRPQKTKLLTVRGGYHGDTLGAMSVCDPVTGMHSLFRSVLAPQLFADAPSPEFGRPWEERHIAGFAALLSENSEDIAAVILEPIVQGAGGMRFYSSEYLKRVRELANEHHVLLILDEIATGFGRTGKLFASEHAGVVPDILCLGKALTGGAMTLAATLCTDAVASGVCARPPFALMHGPTFMGNPLACAAALASIELLLSSPWQERVAGIEAQLRRELAPCVGLPGVRDVRVLGAIGVVELENPVDMRQITPVIAKKGVWLRPFGKLLYTMPPFAISPEDLSQVAGALHAAAREHCGVG